MLIYKWSIERSTRTFHLHIPLQALKPTLGQAQTVLVRIYYSISPYCTWLPAVKTSATAEDRPPVWGTALLLQSADNSAMFMRHHISCFWPMAYYSSSGSLESVVPTGLTLQYKLSLELG